jgi:hypothetical protein
MFRLPLLPICSDLMIVIRRRAPFMNGIMKNRCRGNKMKMWSHKVISAGMTSFANICRKFTEAIELKMEIERRGRKL